MTILLFLLLSVVGFADDVQVGKELADKANQKAQGIKENGTRQMGIPIQQPKEVNLNSHEALVCESEKVKGREDYKMIQSSYAKTPLIDVEPHDPFTQNGKIQKRSIIKTVHKTCFEGGEPYTYTCKKNRLINLGLVPEIRVTHRTCPGHWTVRDTPSHPLVKDREGWSGGEDVQEFCNSGCQSSSVISQARSVYVISELWAGCEDMENLEDHPQGDVSVDVVSVVTGGPETKHLEARCPTAVEQEPIYRDSWTQTYTYQLTPKPCHDCDVLKEEGCLLVDAVCVSDVTTQQGIRVCTKWQKTYTCDVVQEETIDMSALKGANKIPNLSGTPNQNMYKALAQLEGLKQISQHKEGDPIIAIFKGQDSRCSINFGGAFKNCCSKNGGWGASSGLGTKCTTDEQALQKANADKRCIFLGTRVKNRTLGVVTSKEQVYCCYPSKIARAIQEGAKRQLGLHFGSADCPDCRGLTPEELERVDFSLIDLSDAYADIAVSAKKMRLELQSDMKHKQQAFSQKESLEKMKHKQQQGGKNEL
ncbi:MAG: conjugal transfer protein TraN [Alphaproteobacteria bacterium]|nr:conjugal transfer protein TraN [Alphaproteobacteria bacterium]